jgi:hypothetical protein
MQLLATHLTCDLYSALWNYKVPFQRQVPVCELALQRAIWVLAEHKLDVRPMGAPYSQGDDVLNHGVLSARLGSIRWSGLLLSCYCVAAVSYCSCTRPVLSIEPRSSASQTLTGADRTVFAKELMSVSLYVMTHFCCAERVVVSLNCARYAAAHFGVMACAHASLLFGLFCTSA